MICVHKLRTLTSNHLHFQKGDAQPITYCFSGTVEWCTKKGCGHEKFHGDPTQFVTDCKFLDGELVEEKNKK